MRVMKSKSFYESFQENLKKEDALLESANQKPRRRLKENIEELKPTNEGRNSYYGKAFVETNGNKKTLTSYKTKIMTIEDGKITMLCDEDALTQTTLRHIREFLKQNGIEPLPRKELVKLINDKKGLKESDEGYDDLTDTEIVRIVVDNYKDITGKDLKDIFNYSKDEENGGFFKQKEVDNTAKSIEEYLKDKGLSQSRIDEIYYKLDDELSRIWKDGIPDDLNEAFDLDTALADVTEWAESMYKGSEINSSTIESLLNSKEELKDKYTDNQKAKIVKWFEDEEKKYMPMQEQDQTVRVVTANNDREYTIVDITELNTVSDGDVQAPIDITGLLEKVNERLEESVGIDWGVINYQSTRHNKETNDSNALFELCTGGKTYLMSMLLEENGSLFKVNNTKGQTIYKRKTNGDMVGLVESYIKQFLPKNDEPEIIKHINADLHERYDFIKLQTDLLKDVPKEEKDAFTLYLQNQMYSFIAEVSNEIKPNEPTEEDKLELPSFDKMVEDIFGKQWVKEQPKENKLELDGVEELKESDSIKIGDKVIVEVPGNEYHNDKKGEVTYIDKDIITVKTEGGRSFNYDHNQVHKLKESMSFDDLVKDSYNHYTSEIGKVPTTSDIVNDIINNYTQDYIKDDTPDSSLNASGKVEEVLKKLDLTYTNDDEPRKGIYKESDDYEEYDDGDTNWAAEEEADATERLERRYGGVDDESPKNGLGTGYATFSRKAANINEVDERSKSFTDGKASYLVCSQKKLSKEEFDDLQENLLRDNDYCKEFNPVDTENYSYNVIEFTCPDYDYRLLVDPAGYNYCRYVAKVNRGE